VFVLSFFRSANANWAAPAILPMSILIIAWWLRHGSRTWLYASLAISIIVQAAMLIGDAYADRISIAALGRNADIYHRSLGWRTLGDEVKRLARETGAPSVAAEGRAELAALTYYLRDAPLAVVSWGRSTTAGSQFDLTQSLTDTTREPVLLFTGCRSVPRVQRFYRNVTILPDLRVPTGPRSSRNYAVFKLSGRQAPIGPLGRCK
jgi:hypothetical protein